MCAAARRTGAVGAKHGEAAMGVGEQKPVSGGQRWWEKKVKRWKFSSRSSAFLFLFFFFFLDAREKDSRSAPVHLLIESALLPFVPVPLF